LTNLLMFECNYFIQNVIGLQLVSVRPQRQVVLW
jgi:hypothetical protein